VPEPSGLGLTKYKISCISGLSIGDINLFWSKQMGRKKINDEQTPARFPEGTLNRIANTLSNGETQAAFIRSAVERELKRRERAERQTKRAERQET
jgi:hypothetical protein